MTVTTKSNASSSSSSTLLTTMTISTRKRTIMSKVIMIILIISSILLFTFNVIKIVPITHYSLVNSQLVFESISFDISKNFSGINNNNVNLLSTFDNNNNNSLVNQQQHYKLKPVIQEYPYYFDINYHSTTITTTNKSLSLVVVDKSDFIYKPGWDSAPIVIQKYKLIFFAVPKVGCTVFKQLFRRMMGYKNYMAHGGDSIMPHNPDLNGLHYLNKFPLNEANIMMTSPNWTRVLFVREPKQRVLSAYMDKMLRTNASYMKPCCDPKRYKTGQPPKQDCEVIMNPELQLQNKTLIPTFESFLTNFVPNCNDVHWNPQSKRVEDKYWPYISFIGHFETIAQDTRLLLERLGIWDEYGSYGWANNGSIFDSNIVHHQTNSRNYLQKYYTPRLEQIAEELYKDDYNHSLFGYVPQKISS